MKYRKSRYKTGISELQDTSKDVYLVEAAGIEPASADPPPLDLHAYSIFCFNCLQPDGQGKQTAS